MSTQNSSTAVAVVPFTFQDHPVRIIEKDGDPWWLAADVCDILGFSRHRDAVRMLDPDERGAHNVRGNSGERSQLIINLSGLFSLALKSRKPTAKPFQRWVTHDVLPQIFRTGTYSVNGPANPDDPDGRPFYDFVQLEEARKTIIKARQATDKLVEAKKILQRAAKVRLDAKLADPRSKINSRDFTRLMQLKQTCTNTELSKIFGAATTTMHRLVKLYREAGGDFTDHQTQYRNLKNPVRRIRQSLVAPSSPSSQIDLFDEAVANLEGRAS